LSYILSVVEQSNGRSDEGLVHPHAR